MISILFLPHVTSLLWAVSGSHLILCLKSIGITWSPEQNDSLRFLRTISNGQMFEPGQGDGIFFLFFRRVAVTQLVMGGAGRSRSLPHVTRCNLCRGTGSVCPGVLGPLFLGWDDPDTSQKACAILLGCTPAPLGWGLIRRIMQTFPAKHACVAAAAQAAHVLPKWVTLHTKLPIERGAFFHAGIQVHADFSCTI